VFHLFSSNHQNVTNVLDTTLNKLNANDPVAIAQISALAGTDDTATIEGYRQEIVNQIQRSKANIANDPNTGSDNYASRDQFVGLVQTNIGQAAQNLDTPALANLANDWQQYGDADPRWALCPIVSFFTLKVPKHPFMGSAVPVSYTYCEYKPKFTIALMADWGAPNDASRSISALIKASQPDYVIHLGDIYYAGTQAECQAVLDMWPLCDPDGKPIKDRSFALNGNHEMFCGARDYFDTVLPAFNQGASFFRLITQYWQFLGLDTAYDGGRLSGADVQVQWDWLIANLNGNPGLANIFLTHHQPVSAHAQESSDAKQLNQDSQNILAATRPDAIFGWFFGHEHRCVVYDDTVVGYKARLIGNGAIPHDVQTETAADANCTPFTSVNTGTFGSGNAISSWVLLTVEGPKITVEYFDQNGRPSSINSEIWQTTLAGQPLPGEVLSPN
jgi:hypothetical protein